MSGFEIAGIILAVIPFVISGFVEIRRYLRSCKFLDSKIRIALNSFDKEMDVFRMVWNEIQGAHLEADEVGEWLLNHSDLRYHVGLASSLRQMTTQRLKVLSGALVDSRAIVMNVGETLIELRDISSIDATPTLTRGIAGAMKLFVPMSPTREPSRTVMETAREGLVPRKQQLKILRKQALASLKESTESMSNCNRRLTQAVICGKRESECQSISSIVRGEVVPPSIVTRALQDAMAMREASAKVHKITQLILHCDCHFVHLRLDTQSIRALTATTTERSAETKIFFRLTDKAQCNIEQTSSNADSTGLQFFFTGSNSGTISVPSCAPICEELVNSQENYERFFHDTDGIGNTGYLLRLESSGQPRATHLERVSFDKLVSFPQSKQLLPRDIFLIAANLCHSLLRFNSSPWWAQDWTRNTIEFFQNHSRPNRFQQPSFASYLWTPHLLLRLTTARQTDATSTTGEAIYELGKMLLELVRGTPLELDGLSEWDRNMAMEGALGDVSLLVGVRYRDIVSRYLRVWSVSDFDLLDATVCSMFLSDIMLFETLAHGYPQTKSPTLVPTFPIVVT